MKTKLLTSLFITLSCFTTQAQTTEDTATTAPSTVEKSLFNIQTGLLGVWVSHEAGLSNSLVLRTEVGLDGFGSIGAEEDIFGLAPTINIEPRWYYNIAKRARKGRNTEHNSANFVGLSARYAPDWFFITGDEGNVYNQVYIVPKWGLRRNIGKSRFNYEFDLGIGYAFYERTGYNNNASEVVFDTHLRIGYTF